MSSQFRVLLIADHKWRDLPGLAMVKVWLEDQFRITTTIVPFSGFEPAMVTRRPHLVVLNHMNGKRNQFIARTTKRMGSNVAVLPTEGRPQNNDLMKYVTGEFADLSFVDLWLTWSETIREVLVEKALLPTHRIWVTGAPRFDFYASPLRSIFMPRDGFVRRYSLVPNRPIVCWATNFILARHVRTGTLNFLVEDFKNLGISRLDVFKDPVPLANRDLEVRLRTLEVLRRLCSRFRKVNFVLKPHPHEEIGDYETFVSSCKNEGLDNICLVTEKYIWDVLNAADIHIHRLCTTGIEAWLMGIPSINFHMESYGAWNLDVEGPAKEALAGDDLVTDENSLEERIEYYLKGGCVAPEKLAVQEGYITRWFYRVDGLSSFRCAERIAAHLEDSRPNPRFKLSSLGIRPIAKMLVNRSLGRALDTPIRSRMKYDNGIPVDFLGQRDKTVREEDVLAWAGKVRQALASAD